MWLADLLDEEELRRCVAAGYVSARRHPALPFTIYNYTPKAAYEPYWTEVTRHCRGLIVEDGGRVVAKPFPKFFSLGEHLTHGWPVPDGPFVAFEKLDGSLGISYPEGSRTRIATRGSFTSAQAAVATRILRERYGDVRLDPTLTYCWEIIYPRNRIVVDYGEREDLVLLAAFDTATGREAPLDEVARGLPFPTARVVGTAADLAGVEALVAGCGKNEEGLVVRAADGTRLKFKTPEYRRLHAIVTGTTERRIWEALRAGDDLEALLRGVPDSFRRWVEGVRDRLVAEFTAIEAGCRAEYRDLGDRKATAAYFATCRYPAVLFAMLDGRDYRDRIWKLVRPAGGPPPFARDEEA